MAEFMRAERLAPARKIRVLPNAVDMAELPTVVRPERTGPLSIVFIGAAIGAGEVE